MYPGRNTNSYYEAIYNDKCDWYVPPQVDEGKDDTNLPNDNNSTTVVVPPDGDSNGNGWKIAVGILIPLILIIAIIVTYCCYKKGMCVCGKGSSDDNIESVEANRVAERSMKE